LFPRAKANTAPRAVPVAWELENAVAAAINVYRISDWLGGAARAATRTSRFARLVA
jgi:hypothetical protein